MNYQKELKRTELIREVCKLEEEIRNMVAYRLHFWEVDEIRNPMHYEIDKHKRLIEEKRKELKKYRKKVFIDNKGHKFYEN